MSVTRAAACLAAGLVAATLTGCQLTSVKDEGVRLAGVRDAFVRTGATERPATDGETLKKGDRVRTATGGTVTLAVRERKVVLGGDTHVTVPDGATVELARGALLVDRRRGPGLTLRAGDTTVDEVGSGALRVQRTFSVTVAALSTGVRVRTASGDRLDLDPLFQVIAAGRTLPDEGRPLSLTHDAWERSVISGVLADDERLNDLADGLDGPGAPVVPASYRPAAGTRTSEVVLAEAIGRAARADGGRALTLRRAGGSWGVVAGILQTNAVEVGAALSDVLDGTAPPATPGASSATSAPGQTPGTSGGPVPSRTPQPGFSPAPTSPGRPTRSNGPGPTRPPTTSPTTSTPSPTKGPIEVIVSGIPTPLLPSLPALLK